MPSHVVCAIAGPADHEPAVRVATMLAGGLGMPLAVAEVRVPIPPPALPPAAEATPMMPAPVTADPELLEPAHDVDDLLRRAAAPAVSRRVLVGEPAEQLRALAAEDSTALLVVLDEGAGAGMAWLSASPVRRDLDQLACPAVVVPQSLAPSGARPRAVVAIARRERHGAGVTSVAAWLARALGCDLRMAEETAAVTHGTLVVTAAPSRGLLASALLGSTAHELLDEQLAPVVLVPDPRDVARRPSTRAA